MIEFACKTVEIYTDGACSGNPGPGGWGVYLIYGDVTKELYGGEADTTNNKMELTATIEALKSLKRPCKINLYTDSSYVKDGITKWIFNWQKNNWRLRSNKPVKNIELWQSLSLELSKHEVCWIWVKGHSGNVGNDRADELAVKGKLEIMNKNR